MYTAVVLGWRETGSASHVAGAGSGRRRSAAASGGHWGPSTAPTPPGPRPLAPSRPRAARSPAPPPRSGWRPRKTPVFPFSVPECLFIVMQLILLFVSLGIICFCSWL